MLHFPPLILRYSKHNYLLYTQFQGMFTVDHIEKSKLVEWAEIEWATATRLLVDNCYWFQAS